MLIAKCLESGKTMQALNGIKITWLGHATFRIETPGGKTILIDPWVMGNPMCPENEKNVKKVDVMLCTHGHFDHIGDAVEIAKKHNPMVVGIFELASWMQKKGAKQISPMNKGGTQTVGDIKVTMVHPPAASRMAIRSSTAAKPAATSSSFPTG